MPFIVFTCIIELKEANQIAIRKIREHTVQEDKNCSFVANDLKCLGSFSSLLFIMCNLTYVSTLNFKSFY